MSSYATWLILGMTAITFLGFRLGGYLIGGLMPREGRLAYILDRLPAFVLIALLSPAIWDIGWIGAVAGAIVILIVTTNGSALFAMFIGVGAVAIARHFGLV